MSEGVPYADIVILALIAGFILLRLRGVLGEKNGDEQGYFNKTLMKQADRPDPIVKLDEKSLKSKLKEETDAYLASLGDNGIAKTIGQIKLIDPLFSATRFMQGAKMAFEMVFDAFAKGERDALKALLAEPVFEQFKKELDARAGSENKLETTLVSVTAKEISNATLDKNTARLSVRFSSEQVTLTRDAKGAIVEGDPSHLHHVEDEWIFERDVTSKNPNWKIIET